MKCLNEFFIVFCYVDMSNNTNPRRRRLGTDTMTFSPRRERVDANLITKSERGRKNGMEVTSQVGVSNVMNNVYYYNTLRSTTR